MEKMHLFDEKKNGYPDVIMNYCHNIQKLKPYLPKRQLGGGSVML